VLLLRGPQTPGELRARANRLCEFADAEQVEATLKNLMAREDGPFIARLPRAAGARESRYAHLFSGNIESVDEPAAEGPAPGAPTLGQRVSQLEEHVGQLRAEIDALAQALAEAVKGGAQRAGPLPTGDGPSPAADGTSPTAD